jgi:hypothetical protein
MKFIFVLLLSCISLFSSTLHAGARGYDMAFIDISEPPFTDGKARMSALRKLESVEGKEDCWACGEGERGDWGLSTLYINWLPRGVTAPKVKAAVMGNKATKKALQKTLYDFIFEDSHSSVDGLFAYEHTATAVNIYVISNVAGYKIIKVSHPVKSVIKLKSLDDLLENSVYKIPFSP